MPRGLALHSYWHAGGLANILFRHVFLRQHPYFPEAREVTGKGRLYTTYDSIVLSVRHQSPPLVPDSQYPVGRTTCLLNDGPLRIDAPLLMRPWAMQACHSTISCHLGTARTPRVFERFYWWIGTNICTR